MLIRPLEKSDLPRAKEFTDTAIGENYYSPEEFEEIYQKSIKDGVMCSYVLEDETTHKIRGIRITYPPGMWQKGKGKGLNPQLWKVEMEEAAYFQSLFVDLALTGQGWGSRLSEAAIQTLKKLQTKAIVAHSWKESPNDSSGRYLRGLGFHMVASHPKYWAEVNYNCTRCLKPPCQCTAEEMIKYL